MGAGARNRGLIGLAATIVVLTGCVDERVVYRDRDLFSEIPAGAVGMLGYTDVESRLTVCGNCHVSFQSEWEDTQHADAWATLQGSGHAQELCEACHTVNQQGNPQTETSGWLATEDARYHDVQCESCHGPGLGHVQSPDGTQPLAPLSVGLDLELGCGECHNGFHHPFVEEWEQSGHATVIASPAGREACAGCHTGEDALLSWGVRADYLEKPDVVGSTTEHLPITCGVCHDPHNGEFGGQLRFPVDVPSEEDNLCMKCHHKRGTPDFTTFRGPHSPQGPVLLGYGGWWPPGMTFPQDTILATHGTDRNPRLCAGCHVNGFTVTNPATGAVQYNSVGHLFEAIPCLDAQGVPTSGDCEITARTFQACVDAGCHPSEQSARSAMTAELLLEQNLAQQVDALLEQVVPNWKACYRTSGNCGANSPLNASDGTFTTAEGAAFNYSLAVDYPESAIHNPFLMRALLAGTVNQLREDYGLPLPAGLTEARLRELMRPPAM